MKAVLTLDATVVLLTPVVLTTAQRLGVPARPHAYASTRLANSGSLLLPVSNLTNLLAFAASGLSFGHFAALMALPWALAGAAEWLGLRLFFRRDLPARLPSPVQHPLSAPPSRFSRSRLPGSSSPPRWMSLRRGQRWAAACCCSSPGCRPGMCRYRDSSARPARVLHLRVGARCLGRGGDSPRARDRARAHRAVRESSRCSLLPSWPQRSPTCSTTCRRRSRSYRW